MGHQPRKTSSQVVQKRGAVQCQLTLLSILVETSGRIFDEDRLDPDAFMAAMIESFVNDNQRLEACISEFVLEA